VWKKPRERDDSKSLWRKHTRQSLRSMVLIKPARALYGKIDHIIFFSKSQPSPIQAEIFQAIKTSLTLNLIYGGKKKVFHLILICLF